VVNETLCGHWFTLLAGKAYWPTKAMGIPNFFNWSNQNGEAGTSFILWIKNEEFVLLVFFYSDSLLLPLFWNKEMLILFPPDPINRE